MSGVKPSIQALLLCDGALNVQGKWTLQGLFNFWFKMGQITAADPLITQPFVVYLRLGGMQVNGQFRVDVEITDTQVPDDDTKGAVCGQGFAVGKLNGVASKRFDSIELAIGIPRAMFKHPGKYDAVVYLDREIIESRSLDVLQANP